MNQFDSFEEPLRGGAPYYYKNQNDWKKNRTMRGPKRALRLCILCIALPGLLIGVPLYLKHHVFAYQMYPVGMSDMRLIDGKVSTTWCQRQVVRANTTFNAFVLPEIPNVANDRIHVSMVRHLELSDDMKEYWGFYLLKGSIVTVSTCARWPGSSMILIRGHRHLQECAYIGDDSSEELEELLEIAREKGILNLEISSPESPANRVDLLTKHRPEVQFHDENLRKNAESYTFSPLQELAKDSEDNISGKRMKALLNLLPHKANKFKSNVVYNASSAGKQVDRLKNQLKIEIENREKYNKTGATGKDLPPNINLRDFVKLQQADHVHKTRQMNFGNDEAANVQFTGDQGQKPDLTSNEILDDVLNKLSKLDANKRNRILNALNGQNDPTKEPSFEAASIAQTLKPNNADISSSKKQHEVETLDESTMKEHQQKRRPRPSFSTSTADSTANPIKVDPITQPPIKVALDKEKVLRLKRQLDLQSELASEANENENLAIEQGYVPDGIADHHHILNQTNMYDRSNSEFWSSFSSSEETLLNCAGLILSLPLSPNPKCHDGSDDADFNTASKSNRITYTVPVNGYYFFVFNSENEVQDNYIRVKFDIQKTVYNVSNSIESCSNATGECRLPLNFFSNEKVVFELPMTNNETLFNEEFIVISECEPRTAIYLVCVISVPLLILIFAFQ